MPSQSAEPPQQKVVYTPLPGGTPWFEATETPPVEQEACGSATELPADMSSDSYPTYVEVLIEQPYLVKAEKDDPLSLHSPSNSCSIVVNLPQVTGKLGVLDPIHQQSVSCHRGSSTTSSEPGPSVLNSQPIEAGERFRLLHESCNLDPGFELLPVKTEPCDFSQDSALVLCTDNAETLLTGSHIKRDLIDPLGDLPGNNISVNKANLFTIIVSSNNCPKPMLQESPEASLALDPLSDAAPTTSPCFKTCLIKASPQTFTSSCDVDTLVLQDPLLLDDTKFSIQPWFVNLGARVDSRHVKTEVTLLPLHPVTSAGGSRQIYVPLAGTRPWFTVHPAPALSTTQPVKLELNEAPLTLTEGGSTSGSPRSIGDGDDGNIESLDEADDQTCTSDSNQNQDGNKNSRRNHQVDDSASLESSDVNERNASKKGSGQPQQLKDNTGGGGQRLTGTLQCNICSRGFKRKSQLMCHMLTHTDDRPFRCPSPTENTLKEASVLESYASTRMGKKLFVCPICKQNFTEKRQLVAHMCSHTGIKPFTCVECGKRFAIKSYLTKHIRSHSKERPFKCSSCGKAFKTARNLRVHAYTHMAKKPFDKKPFVCHICKYDFTGKGQLVIHMRNHTGVKPFTCPECGKGFTSKRVLTIHKFTHMAKKPFVCHICEHDFADKCKLIAHMCSHTDIKPFTCVECGKGYKSKACLKIHFYMHMATKPFVCHFCNQGFTEKRSIVAHMCRHTGVKPFTCAECGKGFTSKGCRSQHIRIHTKEGP